MLNNTAKSLQPHTWCIFYSSLSFIVLSNTAKIQLYCATFLVHTFFYPCHSLCSAIQIALLSTILGAILSNPCHSLCSIIQHNFFSHILDVRFTYTYHSLCWIIQQQYSYIAQRSWCTHFLSLPSIVPNNKTTQMYSATFLVHTFLIPAIHCAQ